MNNDTAHRWRISSGIAMVTVVVLAATCPTAGQNTDDGEEEKSHKAMVNIPVRPGTIMYVIVDKTAVEWLELDKLLLAGKFEPQEPHREARTQREPAENNAFAILGIDLEEGQSLGKVDYALRVGGKTYPCLGLASEQRAFDPRRWQFVAQGSGTFARMLFEIPLPGRRITATLVPQLDLTIPEPDREIPITPPGLPAEEEVEDASPDEQKTPPEEAPARTTGEKEEAEQKEESEEEAPPPPAPDEAEAPDGRQEKEEEEPAEKKKEPPEDKPEPKPAPEKKPEPEEEKEDPPEEEEKNDDDGGGDDLWGL